MFIIISLLVLGFLIVVHELGHFVVAKVVGIQVDEFSIGFGPKLLSIKSQRDQTRYSFRLLPLGGYVKMAGMEPNDDHINGFNKKPLKDRFAVISAGSLTNFLVAIVLFIIVFSLIGIPTPSNANIIGDIISGSPADRAGLKTGDRIIKVNDVNTPRWNDIANKIHKSGGQKVRLVIERSGHTYTFYVTPQFDPQMQISQIGIRQGIRWERQGFLQAVRLGLDRAFGFSKLILVGILGMVTGAVPPSEIAGPVGITQMIGDAARGGLGYLLSFTAILGINLALVNLLPIPALDGSRLMFLCIEGIRGKPIDPEKENFIHLIGFALLMVLFLLITYNDLVRILAGG
ncbi:MAG TPA: RIP metalloprotease RseP [Syntrophomonadaceae bacterium]|nr:RIP metalloprotease RseP [Syntrophomonadaceae bacterium]